MADHLFINRLRLPQKAKAVPAAKPEASYSKSGCGDRISTCVLRVMSLTTQTSNRDPRYSRRWIH
jgi:hypothetical protein